MICCCTGTSQGCFAQWLNGKPSSAAKAEHPDVSEGCGCVGSLAGTGDDPVESGMEIIGTWRFVGGAAAVRVLVALLCAAGNTELSHCPG